MSERSRKQPHKVINMGLPIFPQLEGGRDFDEEVEERIRLTQAYNRQISEENTRALSARNILKPQDMDNLLQEAKLSEASKSRSKGKGSVNQFAIISGAYNSVDIPRRQSAPAGRPKFSIIKHK